MKICKQKKLVYNMIGCRTDCTIRVNAIKKLFFDNNNIFYKIYNSFILKLQ